VPGGSSNPDSSEADAAMVGYIEKNPDIKKDRSKHYIQQLKSKQRVVTFLILQHSLSTINVF